MAQILDYTPDSVEVDNIIQRYFDIYLPANFDDQMEGKGNNPFFSVNGMMEMLDQTDINNAREVVQLTEGYFKDILNSKYYEYFIADAVGRKKYIFQKAGSVLGTKVISSTGNPGSVDQKYSFESDNPIMSFADLISKDGPSYIQARDIDYDRQATYRANIAAHHTFNADENDSFDGSNYAVIKGDELSKYYIELPLLIMRNNIPMHDSDLQKLKEYSQKVAGGKLELEVSVSPYTVLYVDEVPGSEQQIPYSNDPNDGEGYIASNKGEYNSRMDFYVRAADGLVADIISNLNNKNINNTELLRAVKEIFYIGQDVRMFGSSNSYELTGAIEKIFIDGGRVKIRIKSALNSGGFTLRPITGTSSKILGIASSSIRVGISNPSKSIGGKSERSKSTRNSKGSAINATNIYSAVENRSDALKSFPSQFLGPKYEDIEKSVNDEKARVERERREAAERNRRQYRWGSSQYYQEPIDYQNILIEGFNSLANAFTGDERAAVNKRFNAIVDPQLKKDRDRFFGLISAKITPKENLSDSLKDLYTFDTARIRFFKAYDIAVIKINIFYNPASFSYARAGVLNEFDLTGFKIGLKISK